MATKLEEIVQKILAPAGITINGNNPWDMQVYDPRFFRRFFRGGRLALADSYIDEWWDTKDTMKLHTFFEKVIRADVEKFAKRQLSLSTRFGLFGVWLLDKATNRQSISRSKRVAREHYDLGNEMYGLMLDERMVYSCPNWTGIEDPDNLDLAQVNKLDAICYKAGLRDSMRVLDIGCGNGSFLRRAAERSRISGVGITLSEEQAKAARNQCVGYDIEILVQDYRDPIEGKFDAVVSIGMAEHVGSQHHREFYQRIANLLTPNGRYVHHAIGKNTSEFTCDPFINRDIFPGGELLSLSQMIGSSEGIFVPADVQNLRGHYNGGLIRWDENYMGNWEEIKRLGKGKYTERSKKGWHYYLNYTAGAFEADILQVFQVVFVKPGSDFFYERVR